ncbi:MAG: sulfatase-like hydrolase/transferase [Verrucomicrobiales bacterium]|nr:sulfatase-like hydrolase/transferase [Verrucomicrobiales bacterium]
MFRFSTFRLILSAWLAVGFFIAAPCRGAESVPNIVFLFADDQTSSSLGCYGHPLAQTPHLDSLAAQGTLFRNSFVSQPICWVSRTTILTGLTGRSYGTRENPEQPSPEVAREFYTDLLRAAGYRTGHFGKWHTKLPPGAKPADHFDVFEDIGRNPYYKPQPDGSVRHETDVIADRGVEFIQNQPKGKPFALNLWFNACHAEDNDRRPGIGMFPWPLGLNGMYEDQEMYRPKLDDPKIFEALPKYLQTSITRERYFWRWNTPEKYQTNMRAYLRMVSGIDAAVGRILAALEEAGVADNTIILYSADNGYHMGNRGLAGKWSPYEESIRVPLIIRDPRVEKSQRGQVTDAFSLNLDFPATFLDYAGVPVPERYQGRSLKPVVSGGKPANWRTETFHEHFAVRNRIPAWEGLRNENFMYARFIDEGNEEFLFDLQADPDELHNLAQDPAHAETLKQMRQRTTEVVAGYGGELLPLKGEFQTSTEPHPVATADNAAKAGKDGFARLFDGKSLRGWSGDRKYWSVRDGALTGVTDGSLKMNRFITWTGSTVRNFDLRMKVKVSAGGNSGLQYRGKSAPEIGLDVVTGYQCDVVANNPDFNGMLYEERGRRILAHTGQRVVVAEDGQPWIVGEMPTQEFAPDEWHEYRVLAQGNHLQHWIDGVQTADVIDLDEKGRALEGVLAMQVHVGPAMTIQYRDIRLKNLPDDLPLTPADEVKIPPTALGVKPQGKLPKDWKPPVYGER